MTTPTTIHTSDGFIPQAPPDPAPLPAGAYVHPMDGNGMFDKTPVRVVTWNELAAANDPLAALIRDAVTAKKNAQHWQAYLASGQTTPFSQKYARDCAGHYQKQLVGLLTLIMAGDEAALSAEGAKP